jgi:hypothetical protein
MFYIKIEFSYRKRNLSKSIVDYTFLVVYL